MAGFIIFNHRTNIGRIMNGMYAQSPHPLLQFEPIQKHHIPQTFRTSQAIRIATTPFKISAINVKAAAFLPTLLKTLVVPPNAKNVMHIFLIEYFWGRIK